MTDSPIAMEPLKVLSCRIAKTILSYAPSKERTEIELCLQKCQEACCEESFQLYGPVVVALNQAASLFGAYKIRLDPTRQGQCVYLVLVICCLDHIQKQLRDKYEFSLWNDLIEAIALVNDLYYDKPSQPDAVVSHRAYQPLVEVLLPKLRDLKYTAARYMMKHRSRRELKYTITCRRNRSTQGSVKESK